MKKHLNLILAILLLVGLFPIPFFGYYSLVKLATAAYFAYLAYGAFQEKRTDLGFIFTTLAVLQQPIWPIGLDLVSSRIVNVALSIGLLSMYFKQRREQ